jgi:hypothetical protein
MLSFCLKDSGLFCAGDASGAYLELFCDTRVFSFKLFIVLVFGNLTELEACHFEEKGGLSNT